MSGGQADITDLKPEVPTLTRWLHVTSLLFTFYFPDDSSLSLLSSMSQQVFYKVTGLYFDISFLSYNSLLVFTDLHCLLLPLITFILAPFVISSNGIFPFLFLCCLITHLFNVFQVSLQISISPINVSFTYSPFLSV